jgi:hypothetical protein
MSLGDKLKWRVLKGSGVRYARPMTHPKPSLTRPLALSPVAAALKPKPQTPQPAPPLATETVTEIGGPTGPEPTRFGDWERKGRCTDF